MNKSSIKALKTLKGEGILAVMRGPSIAKIKEAAKIVKDPKDASVLASAMEAKANYPITLDRKDFTKDSHLYSRKLC